tara:strand:+ start:1627 stop:1914 length:288 start_codon:yes stop_codon:yes gene_type:complete
MPNKEEMLAPIWERLTSQISDGQNINYDNAKNMAKNILIKRGHLNSDGTPTFEGINRGMMTPGDRAIDRAISRSGGSYNDYEYNSKKNYAYKKKR